MSKYNTEQKILGGDLGFLQTKAVAGEWKTKFPSLVKPRSEVAVAGLVDAEGFAITHKSKSFNVGAKGSYDFSADRLTKDTDMAKVLTVFGQYQEETGHGVVDLLVTGLPVYEFNDYKEDLTKALTDTFQYKFQGQSRMFQVHETIVIPQSAGAYYDYILNGEGDLVRTDIASENVIVFDIGGRTSDGCIMEASKYSQDSFTLFDRGVWKAQSELRRLIMKDYRYNMAPHEVDAVMRTGTLRLGNEEHNVRVRVEQAVELVYPELRDELTLVVPDFRRFALMLLAGGGSEVFKNYLAEDVTCPIEVIENSEYANASGNYKYGKLRVNNR